MKTSASVLAGLIIVLLAFTLTDNDPTGKPGAVASQAASRQDGSGAGEDAGGTPTTSAEEEPGGGPTAGVVGEEPAGSSTTGAGEDPDGGSTSDDGASSTEGPFIPRLPPAPSGGGAVVLTFDDGPHPTYTPQVLDVLAAHDATAVFCLVGEQVRSHPELVPRIVDDGHALCNHTQRHDNRLATRPRAVIEKEIVDTKRALADAAPGVDVPFFRQPAMHVTPKVAPVAREHGYTLLDWSIDPSDWSRPGAAAIADRVISQLTPGAVVLLHDAGGDRSETVEALKRILAALEVAGYETVIPATS